MSTVNHSSRIPELRRAVRQAQPTAFLVEPRVVRRIVRELHGFARLSTRIPHNDVLVVAAGDVRSLAHPDELELPDFERLPTHVVLVSLPEDHELENHPTQELLQMLWGRLFHGCIDLKLLQQRQNGSLTRARVQERIDQIGQVEFDEAHAVLVSELRLVAPESHMEAFCEFVAVYAQLLKFSPDLLPVWFPSLAERSHVVQVIEKSLKLDVLYNECHLYGATEPDLVSGNMRDEQRVAHERQSWSDEVSSKPSPRIYSRLIKKRERWNERGNTVSAAVSAMRAVESATGAEERDMALAAAREDIATLADRLRTALNFEHTDVEDWQQSLWELLQNSTHGFWNSDKRLLYDLQKVCLDHERTTYQVDLVKWIVSRGKRPLRRPLSNIREVMMAKHLASSAYRLVSVRLSGLERARLARLLHAAAELAEDQMRVRMRPATQNAILGVGLTPQSVPERVAFDKMVEESLDCITERGYLTMGYLRDAISRNDLKLPDLKDPRELIRGDHLLRADDRLDVSLDGVYRRGEFYLRWLQIVSSLAFGTRGGRFLTLFVAIPFGGALVIVVGMHHLLGVVTGKHHKPDATDSSQQSSDAPIEASENSDETASALQSNDAPAKDGSVITADKSSADSGIPDTDNSGDSGVGDSNSAARKAEEVDTASNSPEPASAESDAADALVSSAAVSDADAASDAGAVSEKIATMTDDASAAEESSEAHTSTSVPPAHSALSLEETLPSVIIVGFLLMALIHLPDVRQATFNLLRYFWNSVKSFCYEWPMRLIRLPIFQQIWRSRWIIRIRRHVVSPLLVGWLGCRVIPALISRQALDWWWVGAVSLLLSFAVNSRLGRDAEELTAEWLANAWHDLRARFLTALLDWVIDLFKWLLNLLERFIYAVDEWLRFHSGETWITVTAKAFLGVIWSFVSFLIRIYVNLLIEPTLHPVKHFPVVTVAHKMFLPVILVIEKQMRDTLTPHLGIALAGPITWFNIVFLPGIFGFLVWELKENWRLYASNRVPRIQPVVITARGENGSRLLKPGFHSGALPKCFNQQRRLERSEASFHRFSQRRVAREALEHTERDLRRFVERDLIRLLHYCCVWNDTPVTGCSVRAASNSFQIQLFCPKLGTDPVRLLVQEQSRWLVATVSDYGWLKAASPEKLHSFETALRGFYSKAGIDLVREQMHRSLVGQHPYDVCDTGLIIWPDRLFDREITVDLNRRHQLRPSPATLAATYGLQPVSREAVVFSESHIQWHEWERIWEIPTGSESAHPLPLACVHSVRATLVALPR